MSRIKKILLPVLAAIMCAMLVLGAAFLIPKNKVASATNAGSTVSGIWLSDSDRSTYGWNAQYKFDGEKLAELYTKISGTGTYAGVLRKLTEKGGRITAKDMIEQNSNTLFDIVLDQTDATQQWIPALVSKATNDHVILTLWLAESNDTHVFNDYTGSITSAYPAGLYSTSQLRAYLVGSDYATGATAFPGSNGSAMQSATWRSFITKYGNYIVTPEYVDWQKDQTSRRDCKGYGSYSNRNSTGTWLYDGLNESWDVPNGTINWLQTNAQTAYNNARNNGLYGLWKEDKLWIPSFSETGVTNGFYGLWNFGSYTTRLSNNGSTNTTWLRTHTSLWTSSAYDSMWIVGTEAGYQGYANSARGVRPAFHLDLTAAEAAATPHKTSDITKTFTYDGAQHELEFDQVATATYAYSSSSSANGTYAADTSKRVGTIKATKVGTYIVEGNYETAAGKWANDTTGTVYYKLIIEPAKINVELDDSNPDKAKRHLREYSYHEEQKKAYSHDMALTVPSDASGMIKSSSNAAGFYTGGIKISYIVTTHGESDHSMAVGTKPDETTGSSAGTWQTAAELDAAYGNSSWRYASEVGYYLLWYKVEAEGHEAEIDFVCVHISQGEILLTPTGNNFTDREYGTANVSQPVLLADLFGNSSVAGLITFVDNTSDNWTYTADDIDISNFACKFYKKVSGVVSPANPNSNGLYDAGTYYIDVIYTGTNPNYSIQWSNDATLDMTKKPALTIIPKHIYMDLKADNAVTGGHGHIYGDNVSNVSFDDSATAYATGTVTEDMSYLTGFDPGTRILSVKFYQGSSEVNLNPSLGAGAYTMKLTGGIYGNYEVTFNDSVYTVAKRPITLKIADITHTYGDTVTPIVFSIDSTPVSGNFVSGDTAANSITVTGYGIYNGMANMTSFGALIPYLAGGYTIRYTSVTSDNYDVTLNLGTYTVLKAKYDISGIEFPAQTAKYNNGAEVEYSLDDIDIPDDLTATITYAVGTGGALGPNGKPTAQGTYLVYISFTSSNINYEDPDEIATTTLTVSSGLIARPKVLGTYVYNGTDQTVAFNSAFDSTQMTATGTLTAKNAGTYTVTIALKDKNLKFEGSSSGSNSFQLSWTIECRPIVVQIADYTKTTTGKVPTYIDLLSTIKDDVDFVETDKDTVFAEMFGSLIFNLSKGGNPAGVLRSNAPAGVYEITAEDGEYGNYAVTFLAGTYTVEARTITLEKPALLDDSLPYNAADQTFRWDENFIDLYMEVIEGDDYLTQSAVADYILHVRLKTMSDGSNLQWADETNGQIPIEFHITVRVMQKPTVNGGSYTGKEITANIVYNRSDDAKFVSTTGDLSATDVGNYEIKFTIKIEYDGNVVWEDDPAEIMTLAVGRSVDVAWEITKAKLPVSWNKSGDTPELSVSDNYKDLVDIEYEYYDKNGNKVAEENLKKGTKYTVKAKLKGDSANNFEFVDAETNTVLDTPTVTEGEEFTFGATTTGSGNLGDGMGGTGGSSDAGAWFAQNWWWLLIILVVLLALFLVIILLIMRNNKKMIEMVLQSQQQQPIYPMFQQPMDRTVFMQLPNQSEPAQLQLPSGISKDELADAIAAAMHKYNNSQPQPQPVEPEIRTEYIHTGIDDDDGFYDEVQTDDYNGF